MRQPLSIYARMASINIASRNFTDFQKRANRKIGKVIRKYTPFSKGRTTANKLRPKISIDEVESALDELEISRGDRLIVHSGISNIGKVEGGPAGIVNRLRERVSGSGIVLFPTFPFETTMHRYLETSPSFDVMASVSKMGAVTDVALKSAEGMRSIHPTHPVTGFGDDAKSYLEDHHRDETPFGPGSPFWRLADSGGKILVLGVGLKNVTEVHLPEDRLGEKFPVKVYVDKRYEVPCRDWNGVELTLITRCHDPRISRIRDCNLMEDPLLSEGIYRKIDLGNHSIGVIDFKQMDRYMQDAALSQRFTIYGKIWGHL